MFPYGRSQIKQRGRKSLCNLLKYLHFLMDSSKIVFFWGRGWLPDSNSGVPSHSSFENDNHEHFHGKLSSLISFAFHFKVWFEIRVIGELLNDLVVDRSAERTFTPKHQKQFDQVFEQAKEQLRKQLPLPKYLHGHFLDTFEDEWNALSQRNIQKLLAWKTFTTVHRQH